MRAKDKVFLLRLPHYLFAGGVTFAVEYGTFLILFYVFHMPGVVANTLSFCIALGVSFGLNRLWVFRSGAMRKVWHKQAILYICLALFNLAVTNLGIYYLLRLSVPGFAAKLLFICLTAGWNFVIYQKHIFASSDPAGQNQNGL